MKKSLRVLALIAAALCAHPALAKPRPDWNFVFGASTKTSGPAVAVTAAAPYDDAKGYGFDGEWPQVSAASADGKPFFFSAAVPEGNYRVTVTLGGEAASEVTVKAELRRLMLETVKVPAKGAVTRSFIVNVRTPTIPDGSAVRLKAPRETVTEANAWDERITLEVNGDNPWLRALRLEAVDVPALYLLGDSTVCDQSGEPYASWGQMLPRFFKPTVAVANHGQSGESVGSSDSAGRFRKILSLIKPGDYVLVQFGHNDMKSKDAAAPQTYKAGLMSWARQVQAKGATAVILTPVHRHRFKDAKVVNTLDIYPQMAREAAAETGAVLIDLNAQSAVLYEALGEQASWALFMHNADYSKKDGTHHSPYGAYQLAKIVAEGLRAAQLPVAAQLTDDWGRFDPAKPDPEASVRIPPSPTVAAATPFGS